MLVDFVYEIFPPKQGVNFGLEQAFEGVTLARFRKGFSGIKPPAQAVAFGENFGSEEDVPF